MSKTVEEIILQNGEICKKQKSCKDCIIKKGCHGLGEGLSFSLIANMYMNIKEAIEKGAFDEQSSFNWKAN